MSVIAAAAATVVATSLAGCDHNGGGGGGAGEVVDGITRTLSPNAVGEAGTVVGERLKDVAAVLRFPAPPKTPLGLDYGLDLKIAQTDTLARSLSLSQVPVCGSDVRGPCAALPVSQAVTVPVKIDVKWSVAEHTEYREDNSSGTFKLTPSPDKLDVGFVFKPVLVDAGDWPPPSEQRTQERTIHLLVTFTADVPNASPPLNQAEEITYTIKQDIPVKIPEIGLPTLAAMFVGHDFDPTPDTGPYILVRGSGPEVCDILKQRLQTLDGPVSLLRTFAGVGTGLALADALPVVTAALSTRPDRLRCRLASSVANLAEDPLNPGGFLGWGKVSAEDSITSLILIGAEGSRMTMFNDRGWGDHHRRTGIFEHNPAGGELELIVGSQMAILIPTLRTPTEDHPTQAPAFSPADAKVRVLADARSHQGVFGYDSFNDELSAVFFHSPDRELKRRS